MDSSPDHAVFTRHGKKFTVFSSIIVDYSISVPSFSLASESISKEVTL